MTRNTSSPHREPYTDSEFASTLSRGDAPESVWGQQATPHRGTSNWVDLPPVFVKLESPHSLGSPSARTWTLMLLLGAVALTSAVFVQWVAGPSRQLFLDMNLWAAGYPPQFWSALTVLGETSVLLCILAPLLVWQPQAFYAVLAAVPVGGMFSLLLKALFDAPRPAALLAPDSFNIIGPVLHKASFPSGHSITAFAGAAALVVCLLAAQQRKWQTPRMMAGLIVLLAWLVGVSRVAVGAHWPVDVLAGAGVGWLAGTVGAWITFRVPNLWQTPRYSTLVAIALGATGLWLLKAPSDYPLGSVTLYVAVACSLLSIADLVLRVGVER